MPYYFIMPIDRDIADLPPARAPVRLMNMGEVFDPLVDARRPTAERVAARF